jgi:capsular exopolysaccharide synthesis family protein
VTDQFALIPDAQSSHQGGVPMESWPRVNLGPAARPAPGLVDMLAIVKRHRLLFTMCFILVFGVACAVIFTLQSRYQSQAMLVLDTRTAHFSDLPSGVDSPGSLADLNFVRSQVQILQSADIARRVVEALDLQANPDFMPQPSLLLGLVTRGRALLGLPQPQVRETPDDILQRAVTNYLAHLSVFNDDRSYVITLGFSSPNAGLAQRILAKHIALYLADQTAAKELVISKADDWLTTELAGLGAKVAASEKKLQAFQDSNHLIRSGGETINGHQLADVTAQLAVARGDLLRKEARLDTLKTGASSDSDVLASQLVQKLREQESTLGAQVAQLSSRYGAAYPDLVNTRAALADVRRRIAAETGRMASAAASDVVAARANVQQLQGEVSRLEQQAGADSGTELEVTQLQSETDADRKLYADLLSRSKQVEIQRQIQEPDARVVAQPDLPLNPVFPRHGLLVAVAVALAVVLAGALCLLVDRSRSTSQSLGELEMMCGVAGLAMVPRISRAASRLRRGHGGASIARSYLGSSLQTLRNSIAYRTAGHTPRVFLFTSALQGEGKSTLSMYFSRSVAASGRRVLLIDADLRHPNVGKTLKLSLATGIVSVLEGGRGIADAVIRSAALGVDVLAVERAPANPHDLLGDRMAAVLAEARLLYDVIVIDTPPVAAVDDGLIITPLADATVLVVRWGRTRNEIVAGAVRRLHLAGAKLTGAVLNAADMSKYRSSYNDIEAYRSQSQPYFLR